MLVCDVAVAESGCSVAVMSCFEAAIVISGFVITVM